MYYKEAKLLVFPKASGVSRTIVSLRLVRGLLSMSVVLMLSAFRLLPIFINLFLSTPPVLADSLIHIRGTIECLR